MQQLEREKQQISQLPVEQLEGWQQQRHKAAAVIQSCWRGGQQRQVIKDRFPQWVSFKGLEHYAMHACM